MNPRPDESDDLVEIGEYPRLHAQILRRRLESADVPVLIRWHGFGLDTRATLSVPEADAEFAGAVVREIEVGDEVPDTSPAAYVARIDEHLRAISSLLEELQIRLDER